MSTVFFFIALACMFAVLLSLIGGIFSMARGTEKDHKTSNKMMRARVLFQALAILFLFLAFAAK
jgi:hypothetical protein